MFPHVERGQALTRPDWCCDLINPGTWATVSSFVTLGLTWWESCLAIYVGGFIVAIVITGAFNQIIAK